jgi:hypothetical protein
MNPICKTCGGEIPNHKPSMFDPKGIGHHKHKLPDDHVHNHTMVYGQEAGDLQKDAWQMKCTTCDYKSYMFSKPTPKMLGYDLGEPGGDKGVEIIYENGLIRLTREIKS